MNNGTTTVPNALFDVHLRDLKLAEIKVLLVVYQALGAGDKTAMQCNWFSGRQLQMKTGSSRRAISSAIEMLVQKGFIEVADRQGNVLREPVRRKGKTKLLFRLSPFLSQKGE
jgi:biotin operon repressor